MIQAVVTQGAPEGGARRTRVRTVGVALAGCGVVGGALARLLRDHGAELEARQGLRLELRRVLVQDTAKPRAVALPPGTLTNDVASFLDTEADVLVEAIGGLEPAGTLAAAALAAGRRVVTANKALIAARGPELLRAAQAAGGRLDFEAAVAGGVPVIRTLREALPAAPVRRIRGVLNGTTNFVLGRLSAGAGFDAAVREAQRAGFAEADPSRDLDGRDAADKIRVLAWVAWGVDPAALRVRRRGIVPGADRLAEDARALGGEPRLLAEAGLTPGGAVHAAVEPAIVPAFSPLALVRGEGNRIDIDTGWSSPIALTGPGAGGVPTASALLADLVRPAAHARPAARAGSTADAASADDPTPHRWVVSLPPGAGLRDVLVRAIEASGAAVAAAPRRDGAALVLTGPATRAQAWDAVERLESEGRVPVVARWLVE